ncbi:helix-turn-helix domain-containing protein [Vibrio quintilis]|uniref:HTH cro/C1-type domain-containing protein n=1 Tax=Vibrio quintilis TaxID=1117707 RepID=A0A1M7YQW9_9VIBR|nr:helix-turn-helix transcriptional regulator [Vibrio quintilis]SHO55008.1 hypothetical protein VQ7734_00727 [Vibrio quintilis]
MSTKNASFKSNFGEKLKIARKDLGLNQNMMASQLGISRDTLSRYERGELSPSLEVFSKMLELFDNIGLSAEDLLFERPKREITTHLVRSWGWAKGYSFVSGGSFRVGATYRDIVRLIEEMINTFPSENPFTSTPEKMESYFYALEEDAEKQEQGQSVHEFELRIPIAGHSASLKAEFPDEERNVDKIFQRYLDEKSKAEALELELNQLKSTSKVTKD